MNSKFKDNLRKSNLFSSLDIQFADFIQRIDGRDMPELFLAAALVSNFTRQGHVCIDLNSTAEKYLLTKENGEPFFCPKLEDWVEKIRNSSAIGEPGDLKPLILDNKFRLYLYRYWEYQEKLSQLIKNRLNHDEELIDLEFSKNRLEKYFPQPLDDDIDWQKIAAFASVMKNFIVISGGPGTGKTTTVAKIIGLLLEQHQLKPLRIALATPTGKAAARLQQAIQMTKDKLNCSDEIKKAIPEKTSTIHRLLGSIPNSPYFRYNAQNPLPVDVMIVDEASMVDLALMSKLVQALPLEAKLILVGDKDQLASVEAGAVLGDICDTGNPHGYSKQFYNQLETVTGFDSSDRLDEQSETGIHDCIIQLRKSYRFGSNSGIGALSQAVNRGEGAIAVEILKGEQFQDTEWVTLPQSRALSEAIREKIIHGFKDYLLANDPIQSFQLFDQFRILCALREGPYGVVQINAMVEQILKEEKLIKPEKTWYHGRPIMITRNDYNLNLFNGDIGIAIQDFQTNKDIRVFFIGHDDSMRKFHPLRLPAHETVYGMTVHKSQGSEFNRVLLLLPDIDSPILTRELIYTGISRARESVEVWGVEDIFRNAISRRIERTSGLRDALWDDLF